MKSIETLKRSYDRQKKIFDEKEELRRSNLVEQLSKIDEKISHLQFRKSELEKQISDTREFESFESFRTRASDQSQKSKTKA